MNDLDSTVLAMAGVMPKYSAALPTPDSMAAITASLSQDLFRCSMQSITYQQASTHSQAGLSLLTVQSLREAPLTAEAGDLAMARTPASAARASSWAADMPLAIGSSGASSSTVKKTAMKLQMESPVVMASTCSNGCGAHEWAASLAGPAAVPLRGKGLVSA